MTGFGTGQVAADGRRVRAEVKSVNHRFLDIVIRAPRIFAACEDEVRRVIKEKLSRGHVEVYITYASDADAASNAVVDMSRVASYVEAALQIQQQTGLENDLSVGQILQLGEVLTLEPSDEEIEAAGQQAVAAVREACGKVAAARSEEGEALWKDVAKRIEILRRIVGEIAEREPDVVLEYSQNLNRRIAELKADLVEPQRLAQEVALYADRCNVTEEVIRIRSHLDRLEQCSKAEGPQGRNMDFIAQELNREFNTIGSKSQDCLLTNHVIDAKAEVEKIREQIQNIE